MINEVMLDRKILDLLDCNGQWEEEIPDLDTEWSVEELPEDVLRMI